MVAVTFIKDFMNQKAGSSRTVSEAVAKRLFEIYHVIEKPLPEPSERPEYIVIRVIKPLTGKFGQGWYPNSTHLIDRRQVFEHLEKGDVVIDGEEEKKQERLPKFSTLEKKVSFEWFASHPEYNGCSLKYALNSVQLAAQCGLEDANNL
ncbi:MAG: hypothetical protein QXU18_12045, partial [Thermoplasmatales archaeon]